MNSSRPIIIALDVDTQNEALRWVERLGDEIDIFKVGLQLFSREGLSVVTSIISKGKKVFIDLKFHDIPNTVAHAVRSVALPGVEFLTIHASGGENMVSAATRALKEIKLNHSAITTKILAVTVLTSLDDSDLRQIGVDHSVPGQVLNLARLSKSGGVDGLVCSPHEVQILRSEIGKDPVLVTPGVRLASTNSQDQKRVMTPSVAMKEGSDYLVMGRSLLEATDPKKTLREVLEEISAAR